MPIKVKTKQKAKASGWDVAIADAKRRIAELRYTIRVYSERKKRGESWPEPATRN